MQTERNGETEAARKLSADIPTYDLDAVKAFLKERDRPHWEQAGKEGD